MDTKFDFLRHEETLSRFWEEKAFFEKLDTSSHREPFTIILPPPNANADLHLGHAMYVYEDVMIRYHALQGKNIFWLAGADHAGIETQFVYEKHLKKTGKSRFDFDRKTLFDDIWNFVMKNRQGMENQLRRLGFALNWSHKKFTMDADIVKIVYGTFKRLFDQGLAYRTNRLVNYCTQCGTSFSDLEVADKEIEGALFYIQYRFVEEDGGIVVATTRPETLFGDIAVMVNPKDKRYKSFIGKKVRLPLTNREIPIIADEYVDEKFGTGAVKVTPYHDVNDFEVAKRHHLAGQQVIGFDGKMYGTGMVDGKRVKAAREEVVTKLKEEGLLVDLKSHAMIVKTCYRCGTTLEPLPKEQWFIKIKPLAEQAVKLVENDEIKIHPSKFKKQLIGIFENFIDWNISRQIVWGIRIPAYRCAKASSSSSSDLSSYKGKTAMNDSPLSERSTSPQVRGGISGWFVSVEKPEKCALCGSCEFVQDEDTFDTWFSSAQWPFATLQSISDEAYRTYYPTSVMETGYDILRAWVARMIMIGYFSTGQVPFQHVFLHGMVRDRLGQKMSKSKGNVINPLDMIAKYGADSLRASLIFGTQEGGDVVLSEEKIRSMRNFGNKIWNIGRFILVNRKPQSKNTDQLSDEAKKLLGSLKNEYAELEKQYHMYFKEFLFAKAFDMTYEFIWHRFADFYIEQLKASMQNGNIEVQKTLEHVYRLLLKLLHPYMPFVTEAVWQAYDGEDESILDSVKS